MSPNVLSLSIARTRVLPVIYVLAGSLVLAASARVSTPFMVVPTTLQTLALVVLAAMSGPRLATAMTLTYLAEGLVGLPVFASGAAGPLVLAGPTAGYLLAFPFAAWFVGKFHSVAASRACLIGSFGIMLAAHNLIVASGVSWLVPQLGFMQALAVGATPFILGSLVKSVFAAVSLRLMGRGVA